jgi:aspartate-semialdehyde dehydrogenase
MRVAVLGATGAVGQMILQVLEERDFPVDDLVPLASERSRGTRLVWRGREWEVGAPEPGVFRGCDIALFSAGATRSREWAPRAAEEGAVVVDNSSAWRMDPEVPLVVPEVNGRRARDRPRGIIASPNCVTIQMVLAREALRRRVGLRRVVASSYQSVSGAGRSGLDALNAELAGEAAPATPFATRIAGNVIPLVGTCGDDGWSDEEEKLRAEGRKILELPALPVAATCVRVPVAVGHAVALTVECDEALSLDDARAALAAMPGVAVAGAGEPPPTPRELAGTDAVRVGRLRLDHDLPGVLHLWVVADNLRRGAATNAVQIAELLRHA